MTKLSKSWSIRMTARSAGEIDRQTNHVTKWHTVILTKNSLTNNFYLMTKSFFSNLVIPIRKKSFFIKNEFPEKKINFVWNSFFVKHEFPEMKYFWFTMNIQKKHFCPTICRNVFPEKKSIANEKCSRFYPMKRMNFVGLTIIKKSFHVKKCSRHTANDIFVG